MKTRLLITRPAPSAADTAADLNRLGYQTLVAPVLEAISLSARHLNLSPGDQLIVTSPQAARALKDWPQLHNHPIIAVGESTAALLQASGFVAVTSVDGDARTIADHVSAQNGTAQTFHLLCAPTTGHWLEQALTKQSHKVVRSDVYRIEPVAELPQEAVEAITRGEITHALFYSAFTAQTFLRLAHNAKIMANLAPIVACCLSDQVAAAFAPGIWKEMLIASAPNSRALQHVLPAVG